MRESCDLGEGRPPASGGVSIKGPLNLVWEDLRTALCGLLWNDTWQSIASRLGAFVVTTLVSAVLVAHVRRWADRRRVVATPNVRSLHNRPVPNGGGLVIRDAARQKNEETPVTPWRDNSPECCGFDVVLMWF